MFGLQFVSSFNFTIEVIDLTVPDINEKFKTEPKNVTEIKLGEITTLNFGRFQGNGLYLAGVLFNAQNATNEDLKNSFKAYGFFDRNTKKVYLKVDLKSYSPSDLDQGAPAGNLQQSYDSFWTV